MRVVLEVVDGPHKGRRFEAERHDTLFVGRAERCGLRLDGDSHFSRTHFVVEFLPPRAFLRDLGSSNGTFVNGRKVSETFLTHGDEITGGQTRIKVQVLADDFKPEVEDTSGSGPTAEFVPVVGGEDAPFAPPGYRLVQRIGRGGMGEVFLATRQGSGAKVAIKVIHPDAAAQEKGVRQFLREASVMSKLVHPRIVKFHEVGMSQGRFFVVMEHVPCMKLREWLGRRSWGYRLRASCSIAYQALEGLEYAHGQGMVHRDVKPENLLVGTDERKTLSVKLADFGLAKPFEQAGLSGMTQVGDISGTMSFMAPETVLDFRMAKPSVDIYSMAGTLYWMLSGHTPHEFPNSRKDRLLAILEDPPVPLRDLAPGVPEDLAELVHWGLAKRPSDRPDGAGAFRRELRPYAH